MGNETNQAIFKTNYIDKTEEKTKTLSEVDNVKRELFPENIIEESKENILVESKRENILKQKEHDEPERDEKKHTSRLKENMKRKSKAKSKKTSKK